MKVCRTIGGAWPFSIIHLSHFQGRANAPPPPLKETLPNVGLCGFSSGLGWVLKLYSQGNPA